ncbi:MAG: FecR domain-containing protein [Proteiniphilum sp.]|uniref:FecR family protein n=1 Tax=Proteiniphilum sp. TaxID=1926877 RepID=UPI002B1EC29B|nr:FecR domain-containing protein [Proteiniphilum sp.]MEA5127501.1 FecR domain-containing protein [Proteiniphilum sp.]
MDNKEDNKDRIFQDHHHFLLDEDFIKWRLFQTKESDKYWNAFLIENPHLQKALHDAIVQFNAVRINRGQLSQDDKKDIYRNVLENIYRYKRRRLVRRVSSIAAVLMIGILSVLFVIRKENPGQYGSPGMEIIVGETLPEEDIYIISGVEKINIAHKSHIDLTGDGKALVTDSTDSRKELVLATAELNKLVVPYGKRTNLTLSDGTEIWLNSGTQLDFPTEFTGNSREISVNGEIFINVAHNTEIPFVVHARDMDVYVQGTSFNISAYHDDSRKTVVLVEGKVKVKTADNNTAELLPHEKLEITDSDITKEYVNISEYISWTRGILEFDETPISEILKKIGRYYNMHFESSPAIKLNDKTCSGKLFLSNNLDSVMTSVSVLSSTIYQRENNNIYITKK